MRFQRTILSALAATSALASPLPKEEAEMPEPGGRFLDPVPLKKSKRFLRLQVGAR
jgi:hypothetical protein